MIFQKIFQKIDKNNMKILNISTYVVKNLIIFLHNTKNMNEKIIYFGNEEVRNFHSLDFRN